MAQLNIVGAGDQQSRARCHGGDVGVVDEDFVVRMHGHRPGQFEVAVQLGNAGDCDAHFKIIRVGGGAAGLHHPGDIHVQAGKADRRVGLNPARLLGHGESSAGRAQFDEGQPGAIGTDGAVDHHVIDAGNVNLAAGRKRIQTAGALGGDAHFVRSDVGSAANQDLVRRRHRAAQGQTLVRVQNHVGAVAARVEIALDLTHHPGVERNGARHRLQRAGPVQVDIHAVGGLTGVEVDGAVGLHLAADVELAVGAVRRADVDHRTALRRLQGVDPFGGGVAAGQLTQTQLFRPSRPRAQTDRIGRGEQDAPVAQSHLHVGVARVHLVDRAHRVVGVVGADHAEAGVGQGALDVGQQIVESGVVGGARGADGHAARHLEVHPVDAQLQGHVAVELTAIAHRPLGAGDLVDMTRGQNLHRAGGVEVDAGVVHPSGQLRRAQQANARDRVVIGIGAAHHVDGLPGLHIGAQAHLTVGLDAQGRGPAQILELPPQIAARRVANGDHIAAGGDHALDVGAVGRVNENVRCGVVRRDRAGPLHDHPIAVIAAPADDLHLLIGDDASAHHHRVVIAIGRGPADHRLPGGLDARRGRLGGPSEILAEQIAVAIADLLHIGPGDHPPHHLQAGIRTHCGLRAATRRGVAGDGNAAGCGDDQAQAIVIGPGGSAVQIHHAAGHHPGSEQQLLTRRDAHRGVGSGEADASRADAPPGHKRAIEFNIFGAAHRDAGARLIGVEQRRFVQVEAHAVAIGPARSHADIAIDVGGALVIDPAIGVQHQIAVRAGDVDVAAEDQVIGGGQGQGGVVLQRGDGPGDHQAEAGVANQRMVGVQGLEVVQMGMEFGPALNGERAAAGHAAGNPHIARSREAHAGVGADDLRHRRAAAVVERHPRHHSAAALGVQIGPRARIHRSAVSGGGEDAPLQQAQAGGAIHVRQPARAGGDHRSGDLHALAGVDVQHPARAGDFDAAAQVSGEAVEAVIVVDDIAQAGGAGDVDHHRVLALDPAADENLFGHVEGQIGPADPGVGQPFGVVQILRLQRQVAIDVEGEMAARGLHVADDGEILGGEDHLIANGGVDHALGLRAFDHKGVLGVANEHVGTGKLMADLDAGKAILQRRQIHHGEVQAAGVEHPVAIEIFAVIQHAVGVDILVGGEEAAVIAAPLLARRADAVVVQVGIAADGQHPRAAHLILAGDKIDLVGDEGHPRRSRGGFDGAGLQGELRIAAGEGDAHRAAGREGIGVIAILHAGHPLGTRRRHPVHGVGPGVAHAGDEQTGVVVHVFILRRRRLHPGNHLLRNLLQAIVKRGQGEAVGLLQEDLARAAGGHIEGERSHVGEQRVDGRAGEAFGFENQMAARALEGEPRGAQNVAVRGDKAHPARAVASHRCTRRNYRRYAQIDIGAVAHRAHVDVAVILGVQLLVDDEGVAALQHDVGAGDIGLQVDGLTADPQPHIAHVQIGARAAQGDVGAVVNDAKALQPGVEVDALGAVGDVVAVKQQVVAGGVQLQMHHVPVAARVGDGHIIAVGGDGDAVAARAQLDGVGRAAVGVGQGVGDVEAGEDVVGNLAALHLLFIVAGQLRALGADFAA
ncbi:putative nuclear antigen [Magnetofaba australis IT-1]|uniref:Putative nuclear antigen n=1 Tax=Magnetofaba australis IT-1 TaxID=1434232 RepID=A0A1Y2K440_9PROT|nr:putative nuclear antigen [Magnetofaba australis IT-1]